MKLIGVSSLLLAVLLQSALSASKINIISPSQLAHKFEDDAIDFTLAKFGKVPYGAHFIGGLALADPVNACDHIEHFTAGEFKIDNNIIAVARKGGCSPVVKAKNAQLAGAKILILVQESEQDVQPVGSASDTEDIFIPTLIIPKEQGEKLISFIEKLPFPPLNPEDILPIIGLSFPYDALSNSVKLDLWLNSRDVAGTSYKFLDEFGSFVQKDEQTFQFTPHFVTWDCYICKLTGYTLRSEEGGDCISGGRYCAPDPDGEDGPLTGRDVLFENLRQACVWNYYPNLFWNYARLYKNKCADQTDLKACSASIVTQLNPLASMQERIDSCISESFFKGAHEEGEPDDAVDDNKIFAVERELQLDYEITEFPVLLINHKPYDSDLTDTNEVAREVCRNLKTPTAQCKQSYGVGFEELPGTDSGIFPILAIVVILLVFAVGIMWMYRKLTQNKLKRELSLEASSMVSNYMSLQDLNVAPAKTTDEEGSTQTTI